MKELVNSGHRLENRWRLLISVSVIALIGAASSRAYAADDLLASTDRPSLWFEFGGDFEKIDGQLDQWVPSSRGVLAGTGEFIRREPSGNFGIEGGVTYQPQQTDWLFSISVRYARAQRQQAFHTQTRYQYTGQRAVGYGATTRHLENHMIVDFHVGKDVGLGLSGANGSSKLELGVRIAQFNFEGEDMVSSAPYYVFPHQKFYFHTGHLERRTSAWGPSLSWNGAVALISGSDSNLSVEWETLGALLFGRQKVSGQFRSHEFSRYGSATAETDFPSLSIKRRKNVVIPNLEGSAALSFSLPAAKVTIGYRADAFWNDVDGGIAVHRNKNQFLYGPFARISFGIGG